MSGQAFQQAEIERLVLALDQLATQGKYRSARTVVWIAYSISRTQVNLQFHDRARLAEVAARAAGRSSDPSLALLATKILDPVLWAVGKGDESLSPEDYEALNSVRRGLVRLTARHEL